MTQKNWFREITKFFLLYVKKPLIIFSIPMLPGLIIGSIANLAYNQIDNYIIYSSSYDILLKVFINNAILITVIYLSVIVTNKVAYYLYAVNGFVLGVVISWVIRKNALLLFAILPHGIFEIPAILTTGFIVVKGEQYIRNNFKQVASIWALHILFILFCATIEAFFTPFLMKFI